MTSETTVDFCGSRMTLEGLEMVINLLNKQGEVTILHCKGASLLELGAYLAENARSACLGMK